MRDVRAADLRGNARLLQEAWTEAGALGQLRMQEFERDAGLEKLVTRLVHGAHSAIADQAHDPVFAADDVTNRGLHLATTAFPRSRMRAAAGTKRSYSRRNVKVFGSTRST